MSLSKLGKDVLLIDADTQMNLTSSVLGLADIVDYSDNNGSQWKEYRSKYTKITDYLNNYIQKDILLTKQAIKLYEYEPDVTQPLIQEGTGRGKLSLLLGDIGLFKVESLIYNIVTSKVNQSSSTIYLIEESIREGIGKGYDYVIIDTSPSASSILNGVFIMMSDYFLCPIFPNFFSLQAIDNLYEVLKNWVDLLGDFKSTTNFRGLSFQPKFLGIMINTAKRLETKKGSKTDQITTKYTQNWREKLNKSIDSFYTQLIDTKRTVTKDEFRKIFNFEDRQSKPFIIDELCDFTGQIRNISEMAGYPVVDLNNEIVKATCTKIAIKYFSIKPKYASKKSMTHYQKVFKDTVDSYNYIANSIVKNLK